jgi:ribonuclease P protein component
MLVTPSAPTVIAERPWEKLIRTAPSQRGTDEANLSAEQPTTQKNARVPRSHEQPRGTAGTETPARQGTQATHGEHPSQATGLVHPGCADQRLPRARRIRKRAEFLALQRIGRRRAGARLVVIMAPRPASPSRLGITASRRVGGAVVRNRFKRIVREFFRRHQTAIVPPQDVLVIARPAAAQASYADIAHELASALRVQIRA